MSYVPLRITKCSRFKKYWTFWFIDTSMTKNQRSVSLARRLFWTEVWFPQFLYILYYQCKTSQQVPLFLKPIIKAIKKDCNFRFWSFMDSINFIFCRRVSCMCSTYIVQSTFIDLKYLRIHFRNNQLIYFFTKCQLLKRCNAIKCNRWCSSSEELDIITCCKYMPRIIFCSISKAKRLTFNKSRDRYLFSYYTISYW